MKVKELIHLLENVDPELDVLVISEEQNNRTSFVNYFSKCFYFDLDNNSSILECYTDHPEEETNGILLRSKVKRK